MDVREVGKVGVRRRQPRHRAPESREREAALDQAAGGGPGDPDRDVPSGTRVLAAPEREGSRTVWIDDVEADDELGSGRDRSVVDHGRRGREAPGENDRRRPPQRLPDRRGGGGAVGRVHGIGGDRCGDEGMTDESSRGVVGLYEQGDQVGDGLGPIAGRVEHRPHRRRRRPSDQPGRPLGGAVPRVDLAGGGLRRQGGDQGGRIVGEADAVVARDAQERGDGDDGDGEAPPGQPGVTLAFEDEVDRVASGGGECSGIEPVEQRDDRGADDCPLGVVAHADPAQIQLAEAAPDERRRYRGVHRPNREGGIVQDSASHRGIGDLERSGRGSRHRTMMRCRRFAGVRSVASVASAT